jgi:hypothetical protein
LPNLSHQHRIVSSLRDFLRGVCHDHPALEEQFLDVTQAQLKAKVPAHGTADDRTWKTVTVIKRVRCLHLAILREQPNNLTTPAEALGVAVAMNAGAAVAYSGRVMDAFSAFSAKE